MKIYDDNTEMKHDILSIFISLGFFIRKISALRFRVFSGANPLIIIEWMVSGLTVSATIYTPNIEKTVNPR